MDSKIVYTRVSSEGEREVSAIQPLMSAAQAPIRSCTAGVSFVLQQ